MNPVGRGTSAQFVFYSQDNTGRVSETDPGGGTLFDLAELKFKIFDTSTEAKQLQPVQVYPAAAGTWQSVDLAGAGKLGTGRFKATWTVPADAATGLYEIRWQYKLFADSTPVEASQPFEVLANVGNLAGPFYCLVSDMRSEGVTVDAASDDRLLLLISRASKYIERVTGRFFEPRYLSLKLNGNGSSCLLLGMPLIAIEWLQFALTYLHAETYSVESTLYRTYNRHLSGLMNPDDRNSPRIELYHPGRVESRRRPFEFATLVYPRGQRNVGLTGVFGYTDPDGTPFGCTPELIRRACQLLVYRDLYKLAQNCGEDREDALKRWRLVSERTRDQQYQLQPHHLAGPFTGDPEIDTILVSYVRPPMLGAA